MSGFPARRQAAAVVVSAILAVALVPAATPAAPATNATVTSRWAGEKAAATGVAGGWYTTNESYPISASFVNPTWYDPRFDADTIAVQAGAPTIFLIGPDGAQIQVGTYADVRDALVPTPGHAGVSYWGNWGYPDIESCAAWNGSFTVLELAIAGTTIEKLSVDYDLSCPADGRRALGQIRFGSSLPLTALTDSQWGNDFFLGQDAVGSIKTASYTYSNQGDTTVHLGTPAITGPEAASFVVQPGGCVGATLAAGQSCELTVQFTVPHVGRSDAVLTMATDTPLGYRRMPMYGWGVTPTSITLSGPSGAHAPGDVLVYEGKVTPAPTGSDIGSVKIMWKSEVGGWSWEAVSGTTAPDGTYHLEVTLVPDYPSAGLYTTSAQYTGSSGGNWYLPSTSATTLPLTIQKATQTSVTTSLSSALSTVPVTVTASVWSGGESFTGGTLAIVDGFDGSTIATGPIGPGRSSVAVTRTFATGTHHFTASYSGEGMYGPSTGASSPDLVITKDQAVAASGLGVSPTTFYPVKDGYRDTLTIKGRLSEVGKVSIRITSVATGRSVRTVALGTKTGAYSWAWNGRTSSGTLVAAGKYKIVQTLTDTGGNTLLGTHYATLSLKKLYWTTATKTLYASQYALAGSGGGGSVSRTASSYYRGVRLASGSGWAGVSYAFSVPSATVYGNVTFKVLGRSLTSRKALIGIWNPALGSFGYADAYDEWEYAGTAYAWYATTGPLASHRGSGYVRTTLVVENDGGRATFDAAKVQLTYRYGVLK